MKTPLRTLLALLAFSVAFARARAASPTLAEELFDEGQYAAASIEFRRLALNAEAPADAECKAYIRRHGGHTGAGENAF